MTRFTLINRNFVAPRQSTYLLILGIDYILLYCVVFLLAYEVPIPEEPEKPMDKVDQDIYDSINPFEDKPDDDDVEDLYVNEGIF